MRTTIGAPGAESKRCLLTQHLLDNLCLAAGNDLVRSQTTGQTRGLVLQVVAAVRLLALNLAATGELEALLSTRVGGSSASA